MEDGKDEQDGLACALRLPALVLAVVGLVAQRRLKEGGSRQAWKSDGVAIRDEGQRVRAKIVSSSYSKQQKPNTHLILLIRSIPRIYKRRVVPDLLVRELAALFHLFHFLRCNR